ncbi:MAG: trypsin-like peptidase domain-containing protein [Saprospiraceae bacterium]
MNPPTNPVRSIREVIEQLKPLVIQIATPFSTGTGFYLQEYGLIVTNFHVVNGNSEVVIDGVNFHKQLSTVVYTDQRYDLAFLTVAEKVTLPILPFGDILAMGEGDPVIAVGHPFGLKYTATQGIISNMHHHHNDLQYIQHDAALNPGNSGGPLINVKGELLGVNTFIIQNGNSIGFSLPVTYLKSTLDEFHKSGNEIATRCSSCMNIVFANEIKNSYCPHCGAKVILPSEAPKYEPLGISKTIEKILSDLDYQVSLSRRGPNHWEMVKGSAKINISYHEKTGLVLGDVYLCQLPKLNIKPLYEYLLKENYKLEGLTFSLKGQDILMSLVIYDKYLNPISGLKLFKELFEHADYYDDQLLQNYGALANTSD